MGDALTPLLTSGGNMEVSRVMIAFSLTLIAGLSTGIGGIIAIIIKNRNYKFLSLFLGISAGVMIYVSFVEMLPESILSLQKNYGPKIGMQLAVTSFFCGMWISALINAFIPNPKDDINKLSIMGKTIAKNRYRLYRTGIISAIILCLHNFPEGIATFVSAMENPKLAMPVVFAISLHNIPEGITVAAPIYFATKNKKKAFSYSFYTGLTEPLGAVAAYMVLARFMNETLFGIIFGTVAGIMVFICFDELLPSADEYGEHKITIYGLVIGMAAMATSLVMFA